MYDENVIHLDVDGVISTLTHCLEESPGFHGVIVLALTKKKQLYMRSSALTPGERAHLSAFLQAWITRSFELEYHPVDR